ncbi:MAG: hypothetical protein WCO83_06855 [Alphaproteobacteria bacterium]
MFAAFPLLALPVVIYNLVALTFSQGFKSADANSRLSQPLFSISMTSRVEWAISSGDLILAVALVVLFIELLKSTTSHRVVIINHALSMMLFVACLVEFLLAPAFATSTFFLLTLMVVLDVLAGFIVTIASTRRDIDFNDRG